MFPSFQVGTSNIDGKKGIDCVFGCQLEGNTDTIKISLYRESIAQGKWGFAWQIINSYDLDLRNLKNV